MICAANCNLTSPSGRIALGNRNFCYLGHEMRKVLIFILCLFMAVTVYGQNEGVRPQQIRPEKELYLNPFRNPMNISLFPEAKEEKAARINRNTYLSIIESVDQHLEPYRMSTLYENISKEWATAIYTTTILARLFLSPQFSVPYGYVPIDYSTHFLYAKIPGWAPDPYEGMYSSGVVAKSVESEFDLATGKYKPVMVDWKVYEARRVELDFHADIEVKPVPVQHFNTFENQLFR